MDSEDEIQRLQRLVDEIFRFLDTYEEADAITGDAVQDLQSVLTSVNHDTSNEDNMRNTTDNSSMGKRKQKIKNKTKSKNENENNCNNITTNRTNNGGLFNKIKSIWNSGHPDSPTNKLSDPVWCHNMTEEELHADWNTKMATDINRIKDSYVQENEPICSTSTGGRCNGSEEYDLETPKFGSVSLWKEDNCTMPIECTSLIAEYNEEVFPTPRAEHAENLTERTTFPSTPEAVLSTAEDSKTLWCAHKHTYVAAPLVPPAMLNLQLSRSIRNEIVKTEFAPSPVSHQINPVLTNTTHLHWTSFCNEMRFLTSTSNAALRRWVDARMSSNQIYSQTQQLVVAAPIYHLTSIPTVLASDKDDAITDVELQQWENDLTGDEKITSDEKIRSLCSLINRDIPSNRLTDPAWRSPAKKTSESKLQREWDGKVNTNLISIRECNECEEEKTVEPCKNAEKIVLQARGVVEFSWLKQNITATPPELVPEDVEVFVGRTIIHQIPPDKGELKNESRIPPNGSRTNKHDYVAAPSVSPPADNKVFVAAPSVSPPANNYAFVKVPPMLPPIFHTQLASRIRNPSAIMPYFCPLLANTMPIYWNVFNNGMRFIAGTSSLVFGQWASRQLILNQIYRQKHEQAAAAAAAYRQAGVPTVDGAPNVAAATNNGKNVKSPEKKIYKKG